MLFSSFFICIVMLLIVPGWNRVSAQTISTDTVHTPLCAYTNIKVTYNITGTFIAGNIFSAELSDSSGSFASPVVMGALSSTAADTISATIPSSTPTGAGYRIRVTSSSPSVAGSDNGSDISISNCDDNDPCTNDGCASGTCIYTPNFSATGAWREITKVPGSGLARSYLACVGFSINNLGYVGMGGTTGPGFLNDLWEFDPATSVWTQKADFPGLGRVGTISFSIGNKGYIGTGFRTANRADFWEYDPGNNAWTQKADFGGIPRRAATGFSIGSKGYAGGGYDDNALLNDFWEYDPASDTWTQKSNYPGGGAYSCTGFGIGSKGYMGTGGGNSISYNDFYEYDPATDSWTAKANFPGAGRSGAAGFSIGDKGYLGLGAALAVYVDFWQYDPASDSWIQQDTFSDAIAFGPHVSFSIGNKGYTVLPANPADSFNRFWEFTPGITASGNSPVSEGDTLNLSVGAGASYAWSGPNGFASVLQNPSIMLVSSADAGTYSVTVTSNDSCVATTFVTIVVNVPSCSNSVFGLVAFETSPAVNAEIILYKEKLLPGKWDSIETVFSNSSGEFLINNLDSGTYIILARPDTITVPMAIPTYFGNTSSWLLAARKQYVCVQQDSVSIAFLKVPDRNGNGTISGYVLAGSNKRSEPIEEEDIIITKVPPGSIAAYTTTDFNGYYEVNGLEPGNYQVVVEIAGMTMVNNVSLNITATDTLFENVNFSVDTGAGTIEPLKTVGINNSESRNPEILFYPNPVYSDVFILLNQFNEKPLVLELFNVTGQKIISIDHTESDLIQIKRNKLPSGLYLLRLIFTDKVQSGRIIMQ